MKVPDDRVERLLVAILLQFMKDYSLKAKVLELNRVGFSNLEIADVLRTKPQMVAHYIYQTRKSSDRKARTPRRKRGNGGS